MTIASVICIAFALAWYFEETLLGVFPFILCSMGIVLYVLAFFQKMSLIDAGLIAGGLLALYAIVRNTRKKGKDELVRELRRQFLDSHLWVCVMLLLVMCFYLRGEMILEWDGYNFWGPDTKSLYFRDGFALKHSNAASRFGDYTPMSQLIFWWFLHLGGTYNEQFIFFGYYIFGAVLLFSVADRFRARGRIRGIAASIFACAGAVILPGVACTAWFRAVCVDPLMAMVFGAALSLTVCRNEKHPSFWKAKIFAYLLCLTLIKTIGILWSVLALLFFCLWWLRERREFRFVAACAGGIAASYGSWVIFCRVMERSTYLVDGFSSVAAERLAELRAGAFLIAGDNWGFITSYARAFLFTPIHREYTAAIDISPALLLGVLFVGMFLCWKFGFAPKKKLGRLLVFMALCIALIYAVLFIGQMTMFYTERQYLDPFKAVTLMTRYCAPAHMGLLLLLCTFASGRATDSAPDVAPPNRRGLVVAILTGVFVFSNGAYSEMYRRFIFDPLDESRIEKRREFAATYDDFLRAVETLPWKGAECRVLLCVYRMELNPIVINEASPVSFLTLPLSGEAERDIAAIHDELALGHERFLYIETCEESFAEALSAHTADGSAFETKTLYEIQRGEELAFVRFVPSETDGDR